LRKGEGSIIPKRFKQHVFDFANLLRLGISNSSGLAYFNMKEQKVRGIIRWIHIVFGFVVMCYIYSPFHEFLIFQIIMKFLIIPGLALTGVWIWQFKRMNRFFIPKRKEEKG